MTFEEIYQDYWARVYRLCMGYVNDHSAAQDLAQDCFVIIWQNLPKFRNESSVGTWIFRIATNRCLKQVAQDKKMPQSEIPVQLPSIEETSIEPQIKLLYRFISELPEMDRLIISLELEEVKQAEIAQIVGLKETNVRVKIHRIKEKLTKKFKDHG